MYPELAWKEAETLLGFVLQKERTWLTAHSDQLLLPRQEQRFFSFVERRTKHEPIAYLLGLGEFCGMLFEVNKYTLIPRIETEELVERAAANMYSRSDKNSGTSPPSIVVWDVGTGSGAIAVSIKKRLPDVAVVASDLSKRALRIAQKMRRFYQISNRSSRARSDSEIKNIFFPIDKPTYRPCEYYLPHSDKALYKRRGCV
jgi:release factor glutamine methyltransferase